MTTWLQTVWDRRLPRRYNLFMCLKGLQTCRLSNFVHFSKITFFFSYMVLSYENSATYEHFWFFQVLKFWQPVTLQPLRHKDMSYLFGNLQSIWVWSQTNRGVAAFLTSLRPCLKLVLYLVSYYNCKITNAHNCTRGNYRFSATVAVFSHLTSPSSFALTLRVLFENWSKQEEEEIWRW